jgi:putative DNA primase/helicase
MDFLGVMDADEETEEAKAAAQQTAGLTEPFNLTDIGNMERLVWRHGSKLKYAAALKWLTWDGKRWREDKTGKAQRFAWNTVRLIPEEAKLIKVPDKEEDKEGHKEAMERIEAIYKWAEASEMGGHVSLMLKHAQSAMGVAATAGEFDQDLNLLNTSTGTIDLITGETRAHDREDMLTKIAPVEYDPQAKCPLWEKFMLEIMDGKQHMVDFLQRALGYSLTGETVEHKLFIMWGSGANGKTTMLEVVRHVMGDYSQAAEFTTFVAKKDARTGATPDLAMLRGARFVSATEGEQQHKLAESLVKQLTGGDTIVARHLFCEYFQFVPQFKIWLGTNHKPEISGTDDGIWRRVCLIPFNVSFADRADAQLKEKLKREAPGILAWMVRGLVEWRKHGLMEPEEVKAATATYRADEDLIVRFMNEEASVGNDEAAARDVYNRYKDWVRDNHEGELSERKFAEAMKEHGYTKVRRETGVFYKGFKLQPKQVWTPQTTAMASGDEEL